MGIFDGILLVSDFDGTFTDSKGNIPESNIKAVKYFISEGGRFTISTGRTKAGFHNFIEGLMNAPVVLGNGAMAYDFSDNNIAFVNAIGSENLSVLEDMISAFPAVGVEFYGTGDFVGVINPNERNLDHFRGLKISNFAVTDKLGESMFPFVKVMVSAGEYSKALQEYLAKTDLRGMKYIPTNGSFVEILSETAGKGNALNQLADSLGIDRKYAFCVGDGSNDCDMLESASLSFCPDSGDILAKNVADVIVCSSDEGAVCGALDYIRKNCIKKT